MSENGAITALPTGGDADAALLRACLVKRVIYPLADAEDPTAFDALDSDTGALPEAIAWQSTIFWLDPDDATSEHDGTTVLVTHDSYRYKIPEYAGWKIAALDKDLVDPPADPDFDDAYLVPASATGAWASQTDKIAIFTARGWKFVTPQVGRLLYLEDESAYYHYSEAGTWVAGFGDSVLSANAVRPGNILGGRTRWIVENQTTNAPPASPADGVQYIIGPSPTGAWAGNAGKLAMARGGAWDITTPGAGYEAYDKSDGQTYFFGGATWARRPTGLQLIAVRDASNSSTVDFTDVFDGLYDEYELRCTNVHMSVDNSDLNLRVGTGAGPTWQTSGYVNVTGSETAGVRLNSNGIGNAAVEKADLRVEFADPDANDKTLFASRGANLGPSGGPTLNNMVGLWSTAGTITGIRIMPAPSSGGTIVSGHFVLYGRARS